VLALAEVSPGGPVAIEVRYLSGLREAAISLSPSQVCLGELWALDEGGRAGLRSPAYFLGSCANDLQKRKAFALSVHAY
jgi:hypothetical protein